MIPAPRPVWWMQSIPLRVVWSVAAACWMALAGIALLRPSGATVAIPQPLAALFLIVAAGKALMLLWTSEPKRRVVRAALGTGVGSALALIGCIDPVVAAVEVPLLVIAVGTGNLAIAAVVWRR